jgi:hypothetical protein
LLQSGEYLYELPYSWELSSIKWTVSRDFLRD